MRFRLFGAQSFHQPPKLLRRDVFHFIGAFGPLKTAVFQALVQKHKSVPSQNRALIRPVGDRKTEKGYWKTGLTENFV